MRPHGSFDAAVGRYVHLTIVYDMPYHGKSLPPVEKAWWAERYSLTPENSMALPVQLAQVLGLDRPVFIGSSVGGMLALDLDLALDEIAS